MFYPWCPTSADDQARCAAESLEYDEIPCIYCDVCIDAESSWEEDGDFVA